MPAALALDNGHVVCAQEVVGLATSPWIADTLRGRTRAYRLTQDQYDFGAAPFLARAADGGTLLAFHSQCRQTSYLKQLHGSWLFSDVFVQHGDANAGHFGPASCPWPAVNGLAGEFFPSLLPLKDNTLVVLASFITVHPDRTTSTVVRWIKGRLTASSGVSQSLSGKALVVAKSDPRLLDTALPHDQPEPGPGRPPPKKAVPTVLQLDSPR